MSKTGNSRSGWWISRKPAHAVPNRQAPSIRQHRPKKKRPASKRRTAEGTPLLLPPHRRRRRKTAKTEPRGVPAAGFDLALVKLSEKNTTYNEQRPAVALQWPTRDRRIMTTQKYTVLDRRVIPEMSSDKKAPGVEWPWPLRLA